MKKAFTLIESLIVTCIVLLLLAFVVTAIEDYAGKWGRWHGAKIIYRSYAPNRSTTSTGFDSKGGAITTTGSTREKYVLIARSGNQTFSSDVSPEVWAACPEGSSVTARPRLGYFSKTPVKWEILPELE